MKKLLGLLLGCLLLVGCNSKSVDVDTGYKAEEIKVEIIYDTVSSLNSKVNNWLTEHSSYTIIEIKYDFECAGTSYTISQYGSCMIIYKI